MVAGTSTTDLIMVKAYTNSSSSNVLNSSLSAIVNFSLGFNGDSLVLKTGSGLYLSSSSNTVVLSNTIGSIYFSQDTYTMFGTPSLLLSSVPYTLFNTTNELQTKLQDGSSVTMPILAVPTSYFSGCTIGNSSPITSVQKVMDTAYCSHFSQTWCTAADGEGWVDQGECIEGNTYTYCTDGISCSGNCKSGCFKSAEGEVCVLEGSNYLCMEKSTPNVTSSSTPVTPTDTGISWLWIILIVLAIIIVISLLVWAAYRNRKQPDYYQHHQYTVHQNP